MALPDVRHINTECKGPLCHVGHVRARIKEAQVKVLIAGPAVSLVGRLIGWVGPCPKYRDCLTPRP